MKKSFITLWPGYQSVLLAIGLDSLTWSQTLKTGSKVIKKISYSTQLSTKFILLINDKMPPTIGILTFISMINTTSEILKARNFFICLYFSFYEQLKFRAQLLS